MEYISSTLMLIDNVVRRTCDFSLKNKLKKESLCMTLQVLCRKRLVLCRCLCLFIPGYVGKFSTSLVFSQRFEIAAAAKWLIVSALPMSLR